MSTRHDHDSSVQILPPTHRPARCLRHRVWMAACGECRDVHRDAAAGPSQRTAPAA